MRKIGQKEKGCIVNSNTLEIAVGFWAVRDIDSGGLVWLGLFHWEEL